MDISGSVVNKIWKLIYLNSVENQLPWLQTYFWLICFINYDLVTGLLTKLSPVATVYIEGLVTFVDLPDGGVEH